MLYIPVVRRSSHTMPRGVMVVVLVMHVMVRVGTRGDLL